jgi:hypothetical protein
MAGIYESKKRVRMQDVEVPETKWGKVWKLSWSSRVGDQFSGLQETLVLAPTMENAFRKVRSATTATLIHKAEEIGRILL